MFLRIPLRKECFRLRRNMPKGCPFTLGDLVLSLLVMLTLEDEVLIVHQWQSSHCIATVRISFRQRDARYHGKNLPPSQIGVMTCH